MIDRNAWNCFHRPDRSSRWVWLASGETFGAANLAGLLRSPAGERIVLFGAALPGVDGRHVQVKGERWGR